MKKVLIAVDDTKDSKAVLSVFNNLVRPPEEVVLLNVQGLEGRSLMIDMLGEAELSTLKESLRGTDYMDALEEKSKKILDFYRKEIEDGGLISTKTLSKYGIPAEEIIRVAEEENIELIIMGFHNRKGLDRLMAGSTSKEVEKGAAVPVMLARHPGGEEKAPVGRSLADRLVLSEEY